MKKILTSNISSGVRRQPLTKTSLDHLQQGLIENNFSIVKAIIGCTIGSAPDFTVLYGCIVDDTDPANVSMSFGAVMYQDEIYLVPAASGIDTTGGNTAVFTVVTAFDPTDPVEFTDGNNFNVHENKTIELQEALSGSGAADYDDTTIFRVNHTIKADDIQIRTKKIDIGSWNMDSTDSVAVAHGMSNIVNILGIRGVFRTDSGSHIYQFPAGFSAGAPIDNNIQVRIVNIDGTNIHLDRSNGSGYDNANFDDGGINRGYVLIDYFD